MSIWSYANPIKFLKLSRKVRRFTDPLALIAITIAFVWGFFFTPPAEKFGESVKILYVHVPAAMVAVNTWIMMVVASLIWLIRRHHVSALAAKAAAPIGLVMTLVSIITGALWGATTWGAYWVWDPRLINFFVLFVFYIGYIALWAAIDDYQLAADMTAILALVGGVFALLSRYAVLFWDQGLHQGASLSLDAEENVSDVYYLPLLLVIAGFILFFVSLTLYRTETEILKRRLAALQVDYGEDDV